MALLAAASSFLLCGWIKRNETINCIKLPFLAKSQWAKSYFTSLDLCVNCHHLSSPLPSATAVVEGLPTYRKQMHDLCVLLPTFLRVEDVGICMSYDRCEIDLNDFSTLFVAIASRLRAFRLYDIRGPTMSNEHVLINAVLERIDCCKGIRSITFGYHCAQSTLLDFTVLPTLPLLHSFTYHAGQNARHLTDTQFEHILQCQSLTNLSCGRWDADPNVIDTDGFRMSEEKQMQRRMGRFVSSRLERRADGSFPPPMEMFSLSESCVSSALWQHYSHFTALTFLSFGNCSTLRAEEDWPLLANMKQVKHIFFTADPPVQFSQIATPLAHCTQLLYLYLNTGIQVGKGVWTALLPHLTRLRNLNFSPSEISVSHARQSN